MSCEVHVRFCEGLGLQCPGLLTPTVRLDAAGSRRIEGETALEHVWNASTYEDALLLLREEVSRSGGDLSDTDKVT